MRRDPRKHDLKAEWWKAAHELFTHVGNGSVNFNRMLNLTSEEQNLMRYNFNRTVVLLHKNIKCTTMKFKWSSMSPQTEKVARAWTSTKTTQKLNYLKISDLEKARNFEIRSVLLLRQKYAQKEYRKHHLPLSNIFTALSTECLAWPNFFNILILNSCLNINICNF